MAPSTWRCLLFKRCCGETGEATHRMEPTLGGDLLPALQWQFHGCMHMSERTKRDTLNLHGLLLVNYTSTKLSRSYDVCKLSGPTAHPFPGFLPGLTPVGRSWWMSPSPFCRSLYPTRRKGVLSTDKGPSAGHGPGGLLPCSVQTEPGTETQLDLQPAFSLVLSPHTIPIQGPQARQLCAKLGQKRRHVCPRRGWPCSSPLESHSGSVLIICLFTFLIKHKILKQHLLYNWGFFF